VPHNPVSIPNQPRCRYCGAPFPPDGDRRPREYCSDAHRQADYRKRRQEAVEAVTKSDGPLDRFSGPDAPATISSNNSSTKSRVEFRNKRPPSVPLSADPIDLLGGRGFDGWDPRFRAAIDAEIGVGGGWLRSPDDVRYQIVPRRAR
jgi:hypothetical protein